MNSYVQLVSISYLLATIVELIMATFRSDQQGYAFAMATVFNVIAGLGYFISLGQ
jgi:hypothetical protein